MCGCFPWALAETGNEYQTVPLSVNCSIHGHLPTCFNLLPWPFVRVQLAFYSITTQPNVLVMNFGILETL